MQITDISLYGFKDNFTCFFQDIYCKECSLVRIKGGNKKIKSIIVNADDDINVFYNMLKENKLMRKNQKTITFKQFQKILLMYKLMGFKFESIEGVV